MMTEENSRLLNDRYLLGAMIGSGGMADVYEGFDTRLSRKVAIKILRRELSQDSTFLHRFRKEAMAAAALAHDGIVSIYDALIDGDDHYIVMELVNGITLREYLSHNAPLSEKEALEITQQILEALEYSHEHGVVHRDIKPGNIMITSSGKVKVTDFGIARRTDDAGATLTNTWNVVGTAQYIAPEQALGEEVDQRSDIYAVGALLFEMLCARPLFTGETPISIAYQHVSNPHPRLCDVSPELNPNLDAILDHALAKQKEDRYQNATAFLNDIDRVLSGNTLPEILQENARVREQNAVNDKKRFRNKFLAWTSVPFGVIVVVVVGLIINSSMNSTIQVQNVIGETLAQAKSALSHFKIEVVSEPNSSTPKGRIAVQLPLPLAQAKDGSVVKLTISDGPGNTLVPADLVGLSLDEARAQIASAGLILTSTMPVSSSQAPGTVLSSNPAPGKSVTAGSSISLQISSGVAPVPNLVGLDKIAAETLLTQDGFLISVNTAVDNTQAPGIVLSQTPGTGSSVSIGSLVTITVNSGGQSSTSDGGASSSSGN